MSESTPQPQPCPPLPQDLKAALVALLLSVAQKEAAKGATNA